jgi:hypothetical protein
MREDGGKVVYVVSVCVCAILSDDKSYSERVNASERLMSSG